jgi:hypothetical protein
MVDDVHADQVAQILVPVLLLGNILDKHIFENLTDQR